MCLKMWWQTSVFTKTSHCDSWDQMFSACCSCRGAVSNGAREHSILCLVCAYVGCVCACAVACVCQKLIFISMFVCSAECGSCFQHVISDLALPSGIFKAHLVSGPWPLAMGVWCKLSMVHVWVFKSLNLQWGKHPIGAQLRVSWKMMGL